MSVSARSRQKILDFIRSEIEQKGYPPSVREICAAVGLKSTSTVHAHLNSLEKSGLIRRDATKPRALELLDNSLPRVRNVPLIGETGAGLSLSGAQDIKEYVTLPQQLAGDGKLFALRLGDDASRDFAMLKGDIVIVREAANAEAGATVITVADGRTNLERFRPEATAEILGEVVALLRQFRSTFSEA